MKLRQLLLGLAAFVPALPCEVQAQSYPNRPIRLIAQGSHSGFTPEDFTTFAHFSSRLGGNNIVNTC